MDQNWPSGPNWNQVDLIGPNRNCLIYRENKLSSKSFREKIIHYIIIKNLFILTHHMDPRLVISKNWSVAFIVATLQLSHISVHVIIFFLSNFPIIVFNIYTSPTILPHLPFHLPSTSPTFLSSLPFHLPTTL